MAEKRLIKILFAAMIIFFAGDVFCQGISLPSKSQKSDTTKNKKSVFKENIKIDPFIATDNRVEKSGSEYDSCIWDFDGIQNYNPMFNDWIFNTQSLGDVGMPAVPYLISQISNPGFNHGWSLYDGYLYNYENTPFYRTFEPFTRLQYAQTKKEYIHLQGLHTQNITPGWNAALRFQTINNIGFYPRQKNSLRQFGISSRYMDLKNRYYAQVGFNYNKMTLQENGAWQDEHNFDSLSGVNKSAEVNLENSSSQYLNRDFGFEQVYWYAGSHIKTSDTTRYFKPLLGLKHQSTFSKTINRFMSEGSDMQKFEAIYFDSLKTNDSTVFAKQVHRLGLTNYSTDSGWLSFYLGAGIELNKVRYSGYSNFKPENNFFIDGNINISPISKLDISAEARSYLSGYNSGDLFFDGIISYKIKKGEKNYLESAFFKITAQKKSPDFVYQEFLSNHIKWSNNFQQSNIFYAEAGLSGNALAGKWALKIANTTVNAPIFLGYSQKPEQYSGTLNRSEIYALKNFKLGGFHLNNKMIFQIPADFATDDILSEPAFSTYNSLYYQNDLFKSALKLMLGADFRWYSEFYASAYSPVTHLFYLQGYRMQGNYPIVDLFAAGEIKTFRIFVKLEHSNFELFDNSQFPNLYYSTPGYSLTPRRFTFGIQWKLYY